MKKNHRIFVVVLAVVLLYTALYPAEPISAEITYTTYANARFGYSIDYPASFKVKTEPDNGDGLTFTNKKRKLTLGVWGAYNIFEDDGRSASERLAGTENRISQNAGDNFYSYTTKNGSYYTYTYVYLTPELEQGFYITYPKSQKAYVKKVAKVMRKSIIENQKSSQKSASNAGDDEISCGRCRTVKNNALQKWKP